MARHDMAWHALVGRTPDELFLPFLDRKTALKKAEQLTQKDGMSLMQLQRHNQRAREAAEEERSKKTVARPEGAELPALSLLDTKHQASSLSAANAAPPAIAGPSSSAKGSSPSRPTAPIHQDEDDPCEEFTHLGWGNAATELKRILFTQAATALPSGTAQQLQ